MERSSLIVAVFILCAFVGEAYAHGGMYQPPPPPAPPDDEPPAPPPPPPSDPPSTPDTKGKAPSTGTDITPPSTGGGGDDGEPPSTPGGRPAGPATGGEPAPPSTGGPSTGGPPTGRGRSSSLSPDHWTRWWYANRAFVIDLRARAAESRRVVTPGGSAKPRAELWREQAQVALLRALDHENDDMASGAAIALGKAGDLEAVKPLRTVLADARRADEVREAAALALGLLGVEADAASARETRSVLERVAVGKKEPQRLRAMAVYALGLRGATRSVPFLVDVANGHAPSWDVPAAGASALGIARDPSTQDELLALLRGPKRRKKATRYARVYAAHGLARSGDRSALPALRIAATDDDRDVRRAAVLALGALSNPADEETAKTLDIVIYRDKDRATRNMAAISIGRIGNPAAERTLRFRYAKGASEHQRYAALGLGLWARQTGDRAIAKLLARDFERRANADLRGALAIAIGLAGDLEQAPVLRKVVADRGNPEVRAHAAVGLGLMGDTEGAPKLLREILRKKGDPVLVRETALALGLLGDRESVKILVDLVTNEDSVYVQGSAAVALGRIGGGESVKALVGLLEDEQRPLVARAMGAVGLGLLLDRTEGRGLQRVGADLNWYVLTPTVEEILTIL